MKNVSAFLKRHSALLLLVLVLATVPAGIAFGKYVKSVNVTSGISVTVEEEKEYIIDKNKMWTALQGLSASDPTTLSFVKGSDAAGMQRVDTTGGIQAEGSGEIGVYQSGTAVCIAPVENDKAELYAPQDCSHFLDDNKTSLGDSLKSICCSSLNTSNVTDMRYMFQNCSGLTSLDVSMFDTSKVMYMAYMFFKCSELKSLDLSSFKTSEVTRMGHMFSNCSGLTSLNVSMFDTAKVENMQSMFYNCSGLNALDLSMLDTSNVKTMANMFQNCSRLTSLNVGFNTSNVTIMNAMFSGCSRLTLIDVSSFDTSKVMQMQYMFQGCSDLTTINASDKFNTDKVRESFDMFTGCSSLVGGNGTTYNSRYTDETYARIDGGKPNPGYFTGDLTTQSVTGYSETLGFGLG